MKKIILLMLLVSFSLEFAFASGNQSYINLHENRIERYQEEIDELVEYEMKYWIIKDIKYFEKLLEKYEFIVKREKEVFEALKYFKKCVEENEACTYSTYNSSSTSLWEINNLISESSNLKWEYEKKVEKLKENLDYLHKSQKEIEEREKTEWKKSKFEAEKSEYVEDNSESWRTSKEKSKKKKDKENLEKILKNKLEKLTEKYSQKQKMKIYKAILKKLENYEKNEKVEILIKILRQLTADS